MSVLSMVPRGIVIAMQVSLVALVLLAAVPLAMGGINVNAGDGAVVEYDDENYAVSVTLSAYITSSGLYFDITGFRCDVTIATGGKTVLFDNEETTIPKNGTTSLVLDAEVPVATVMMMMLLAASDDSDVIITVSLRGSTLGGMITASASTDAVVSERITDGTVTIADDHIEATFKLPGSDILDDLLVIPGSITFSIGDMSCTVTYDDVTKDVHIDVTCAPGSTIMDDIYDAMNADGSADILYDSIKTIELTKEQMDMIIEILRMLTGGAA
ncbi:MAG: hypothetical protein LBV13_02785 [Methanomassiliicoccaceae archaeon]|jgi:hypothetical protein|nr:hypothetical protein [Methanomassiliicoccaceae archaeon]